MQGPIGPAGATGQRGATGTPQAGNDIGDMQYWDGNQWQIMSKPSYVPANPKVYAVATLQFCNNGKPTWNKICDASNNTIVYHLGDTGPAGGKVFYLSDNTGRHGLEAAPVDQSSSAPWGCAYAYSTPGGGLNPKTGVMMPPSTGYTFYKVGAFGTDIGTGASNTAIMLSSCSNSSFDSNTAANIASSYTLNGYHDWFLPSRDELNLIYAQNLISEPSPYDISWWSSTESEIDPEGAWAGPVIGKDKFGGGNYDNKQFEKSVRAIRAF